MSVLRNMLRLGYFHCLIGTILSSSLDQIIDVSCYNRYNNGTSYRGNVRRTENGTPCIKWKNSNSTYSHFTEDHNFCRNPLSKDIERPWCYTNAQLKYGKCKIPACDCRNTISDLNYNGTIHTTRNGNTCRLWSIGSVYQHETANYCRTPFHDGDNAGGPWCYIDDGSWERCNIPVCGGSFCPDLSTYHLLTMDKRSKYQYGEIAIVVSCQKGYRHIEKTYLECTSTGVWNDTVPTCEEITCQPFILDNSVHASIQPDLNKYIVSTRITLSCIPGYIGPDTFTVCKVDGQWSSQQTPSCTQITCQPFILDNSLHASIQPDLNKYNVSTRITLSCIPGYIGPDTFTVCKADGQWSSQQTPNCAPSDCKTLIVGVNVKPSKQLHKFNEEVTLSCEIGYIGDPISIKCYSNGSWPIHRLNCKPVTCRALRPLPHQKLEPDQMVSSYRDNITFKCDDGYELTTEYTMVTCQSDGTWSNKQPNCTEKSLSYKDSLKKRGKCISYGLFGGILAAIVSISAGGHIATCFYYRKQAGKSAAVYEDMKFNTVERQITSNEDTYSELT